MMHDFNWLKALRWTMSRFLRQLHWWVNPSLNW